MIEKKKTPEAESEDVATLEKAGLRIMLAEGEVLKIVPVSPVTLWRMVKRGEFPSPTFITANKKIWFADEVIDWQAEINGRGRGRRNHPRRRPNS